MPVSEAQKRATAKWQRKVYRIRAIKLHTIHDKDILDYLEAQNKQGTSTQKYIKDLIRKDIKEHQE